jgi:hypothetical protein
VKVIFLFLSRFIGFQGSSAVYWKMVSGASAGVVAQSLMYPGLEEKVFLCFCFI